MKNRSCIFFFGLVFTFLIPAFQLQAQGNLCYKHFDEETYEKLTKDVDYKENIKQREEKETNENFELDSPDLGNWSLLTDVLKGLGIFGIIILLAYIVFRIFDQHYLNRSIKNISDSISIDNLEEHIHELDLFDFLTKALQEGNYKLAVRIHYLIIIKELSVKNYIEWKKQKTNGEYLSALFGQQIFPLFQKSTTVFERIWYGDIDINEKTYLNAQSVFTNILDYLSKNSVHENR